jgi:replicative DNA helicase
LDKLDKTVPANPEAEEAVLGSLLIDPDAVLKVASFLEDDDFYRERNGWIYRAILDLHERREPADFVTLCDELERRNILQEVGGAAYITQLVNNVPSAAYVEHYGHIVERTATLRRLIEAAGQVAALAYEEAQDVDEVVDRAEQIIFNVAERRVKRDLAPVRSIMHDVIDRIEYLHRHQGQILGVPSGFTQLDRLLGGFQKSDLIILAARPAIGKTSLSLNFALNAARKFRKVVAYFSLEMSSEQLVQRLLSTETGIDQQKLRKGEIEEREWDMLMAAAGELASTMLYIDDTPAVSALELRTKARRLQAEHGLDLIVVDYLQLMRGDNKSENRVQEISYISRALKGLARELECPVIALSQLSRAVESRTDHKPMLSDLRESGCLTGETLITLAESGRRVPIRELVGHKDFAVWSLEENCLQLQTATVTAAFSTGIKPVSRLTTRLGRVIRATANHPFRTFSEWRRLDELKVGEKIAVPRRLSPGRLNPLSCDQVALLGHLIGDGCTLPRHAMQYTTNDQELADMVVGLTFRVFGESIDAKVNHERRWIQVYLRSAERLSHGKRNPLAQWLDALGVFGLRSFEKRVPQDLFTCDEDRIGAFLRHLWSTDGCVYMPPAGTKRPPSIYYASSSPMLARDVQALLLRLGINAVVRPSDQGAKGKPQWHVMVMGKSDTLAFSDRVGAVGTRRSEILHAIVGLVSAREENTNRDVVPSAVWRGLVTPLMADQGVTSRQLQARIGMRYMGTGLYKQNVSRERMTRLANALSEDPRLVALARGDVYWDEIVAIEPDGEEEVFDLTVPALSNFVANDIVVHNSIEQDSDIVMFIYREDLHKENSDKKNIADIIVAKHRNGPTDTIPLYFRRELTKFENLEMVRESLNE